MPGGQYTNLKEQAAGMGMASRWPEIARTYAEVNQLCGDIIKVTPSSKVVGDLAIECVARGVKPGDIINLKGAQWSKDVTSMFEGWLGEPFYGLPPAEARDSWEKWNALADAIVGKAGKRIKGRPGLHAAKIKLDDVRDELDGKLKRKPTEDDVWSYLMYPDVFLKFAEFRKSFGDVSALPSPAYFYGLQQKQEIHVDLEEGKTLFIQLVNLTEPDSSGQQTAIFDLNGYPRHTAVTNHALAREVVTRPKANPAEPAQIGAPMPGMVASIAVTLGQKVKEGETLLTLEAMKMFAAISAPAAGTIQEICVKVGESVESKDLLVRLAK
jgi:pyruvate carboxylase